MYIKHPHLAKQALKSYLILVLTLSLCDVRMFSVGTNEDMQSQCLITIVHTIQSRNSKNRCLGLVTLIICIKSCKQKTTVKDALAFR